MKKIVCHRDWGMFKIPEEVLPNLKESVAKYADGIDVRTDPALVEYVESHPEENLQIGIIPDEATDMHLVDYDGKEDIIYVLDGKINRVFDTDYIYTNPLNNYSYEVSVGKDI